MEFSVVSRVYFSKPLNQAICSKTPALRRGSSQAASGLGITCLADYCRRLCALEPPSMSSDDTHFQIGKHIVDQRRHGKPGISLEHICDYICYPTACSTNVVIQGYWVGPDIEDGWGYIEAVVDRNFHTHKSNS